MIIKFLKNNRTYNGTVKAVDKHTVKVSIPQHEEYFDGGFMVYKDDGKRLIGDYSAFIYAVDGEGLFSDVKAPTPDTPKEPTLKENVDKLLDDLSVMQEKVAEAQEMTESEIASTQLAVAEAYEQALTNADELTNIELAICEIYENMGV